MPDFTDRVVLVTGAGSGIGRAAALAFARAGASVLGVGRRQAALAQTAAAQPGIEVLTADLRAEDGPETVVRAAVARWGRLDVLVNNAGGYTSAPLAGLSGPEVRELFELNVIAPGLLAAAALPHLKAARGSIVNVSSTFGHRPLPDGGAFYAASKAAVEQLTRSWALELAADGIRVNAVAPGPTESEALAASGLPAEAVEQIEQQERERVPLGRRGRPAEVALWLLRLADPAVTWLTGQVLTVDGGLELV